MAPNQIPNQKKLNKNNKKMKFSATMPEPEVQDDDSEENSEESSQQDFSGSHIQEDDDQMEVSQDQNSQSQKKEKTKKTVNKKSYDNDSDNQEQEKSASFQNSASQNQEQSAQNQEKRQFSQELSVKNSQKEQKSEDLMQENHQLQASEFIPRNRAQNRQLTLISQQNINQDRIYQQQVQTDDVDSNNQEVMMIVEEIQPEILSQNMQIHNANDNRQLKLDSQNQQKPIQQLRSIQSHHDQNGFKENRIELERQIASQERFGDNKMLADQNLSDQKKDGQLGDKIGDKKKQKKKKDRKKSKKQLNQPDQQNAQNDLLLINALESEIQKIQLENQHHAQPEHQMHIQPQDQNSDFSQNQNVQQVEESVNPFYEFMHPYLMLVGSNVIESYMTKKTVYKSSEASDWATQLSSKVLLKTYFDQVNEPQDYQNETNQSRRNQSLQKAIQKHGFYRQIQNELTKLSQEQSLTPISLHKIYSLIKGFKIVASCLILQTKLNQPTCLNISTSCFWNKSKDGQINFAYGGKSCYVTLTLYGMENQTKNKDVQKNYQNRQPVLDRNGSRRR